MVLISKGKEEKSALVITAASLRTFVLQIQAYIHPKKFGEKFVVKSGLKHLQFSKFFSLLESKDTNLKDSFFFF